MDYALIDNGIVVNIIYLHPMNADEFPNAVPTNDLPIEIGDTYTEGKFYRDGKEIVYVPTEPTYTLDEAATILAQEVSQNGYDA